MNAARLKTLIEAYNHGDEEERKLVLNGTAVWKIIDGRSVMSFYTPLKKGTYDVVGRRWTGFFERRKNGNDKGR